MGYDIIFPSIFIYWLVSISCIAWFVLVIWNYTIIKSVAIFQNRIYILSSHFINSSLTGIGFNRNLPPLILLFTIFKHMCLATFSDDSNPPLNSVQLMVSKVLMFHYNKVILPSSESYDLSPVNNDPNKRITPVLFGIPVRNQIGRVEVAM